jgi:predicted transcriptional regulator
MGRIWTSEDLELLRKLWLDTDIDVLSKRLNRSKSAIYGKVCQLKLQRSEAYKDKMNQMFAENLIKHGVKNRFKKGHKSHNKGKPMHTYVKPEMMERMKIGQFKKGSFAHNRLPIGTERLTKDGYLQVKICDGRLNRNWELKHRLVWERHFGKIPSGDIVVFKDGNPLNCEIDNLKLISKLDNMNRNCYSDEIIVKRLMGVKDEALAEHILTERRDLLELKKQNMNLKSKLRQHDK